MIRLLVCAAVLLALGTAAPAQPSPGDYIATIAGTTSSVVSITPAGSVQTLFTVPFVASAVTMATNNVDLAVLGQSAAARMGFVATVTLKGTVTTLASYTSYIYENLAGDTNGTYVVPLGSGGTDMVLRIDRSGGMMTLLPTTPIGGGKPRGIAVDIGTGGYLIGDIPNLFLIAPNGTPKTLNTNVAINNSIDMLSDARTGAAIISQQNSLVAVDTFSGTMTTIQGGFGGCFPGLAYDRKLDAWVMAGSCAATNSFLFRIARGGGATTLAPLAGVSDVEVYGSRNIVAASDPMPGTTLSLRFSELSSAGDIYLAGASLSTSPGVPTPVGIVDLTPDVLFSLSQLAPAIFVNFLGVLDATGAATAAVVVPPVPGLKGLRFYISFVTVRGSAIRTIANTVGFTIQ